MLQTIIEILILLVLAYIALMLHFAIPVINHRLGEIENHLSELANDALFRE